MISYKEYFKGKNITVMRIGLLGRGVGDTKFLAEMGANINVVDDAPEEVMKPSVEALKDYPNVKFSFGPYKDEDFLGAGMILKGAGAPLNLQVLLNAKDAGVPIEMSASLFAKLSGAKIVGVTGTRGKSTVTQLVYEILKADEQEVFLGGNVRGVATLPLLKEVSEKSIVVLELDSWQLQGFGDANLSPQISVFTSFLPDHLNYYDNLDDYFADKANIYQYQNDNDLLITTEEVSKIIESKNFRQKARKIISKKEDITGWDVGMIGEHNRLNASLAVAVVRELGVSEEVIKKVVKDFTGVEGRLQFLGEKNGVKVYNDNNATSPEAVVVAFDAVGKMGDRNIIWIGGGTDKGFEYENMINKISEKIKMAILFEGSATNKISEILGDDIKNSIVKSMIDAVNIARENAKVGDIILLSPGASSKGLFKNEYERNDQFMEEINKII